MRLNTLILFLFASFISYGQVKTAELKMVTENHTIDIDLSRIIQFDGISYEKIKFIGGDELKNKGYLIYVKEIKNGEIIYDEVIVDSNDFKQYGLNKVKDSIFNLYVLAKKTNNDIIKVDFRTDRFSVTHKFQAVEELNSSYVLKNLVSESNLRLSYNKKNPLFAYILSTERADFNRSYSEVTSEGYDFKYWYKKFGIKHYLIFEIKFKD